MQEAAATSATAIFGLSPILVSTLIMVAVYAVIIAERVNRSIIALLGACLVVFLGVLTFQEAVDAIDFNTIGLLTGMMILVAVSRRSGMFEYLAVWAAKLARAEPWAILVVLQITTAVLSAALDNVTTVLLVVPVTIAITRDLKVPAYPFLFAEIFASNIGGTATLIGDPPNILIGSSAGLSFDQFIVQLGPLVIVVMAVQAVMIHLVWGREMKAPVEARKVVMAMDERATVRDPRLLKKSIAVLAVVMAAFTVARPMGWEPGAIALFGAAALMLLDGLHLRGEEQQHHAVRIFNEVEWVTIFFFIGLFIVVRGIDKAGVLRLLAEDLVRATGGHLAVAGSVILWASAVLSAIVDNIPFVATMIPLVKDLAPELGGTAAIHPLWWCLSLGACLGGNGTLIGASANLTVAGLGDRSGIHFRFLTYTKLAFPMMLVSIAMAQVYVWLRYLS